MGLSVDYGCYEGGYPSFNLWRDELAKIAGYSFKRYPDSLHRETPIIDWEGLDDENLGGIWKVTPKDPLMILIAHYDTEGMISKKHTKLLAERLDELLALVPRYNKNLLPKHINNRMYDLTSTFIEGLLLAHKHKKDVMFK